MPWSSTNLITRSSACLCKQVALTVTGEDQSTVLCHCDNCKARTGSAFGHNHLFMDAVLTVHTGQDLIKRYGDSDTKSGATLSSYFCSNCGSPLYLRTSAVENFLALAVAGMVEEKRGPHKELFTEAKYSWVGDVFEVHR